ncbi:MAG: hypothetical protein K0R65_1166 [Crocinitomicaceae bacterium]|jgi:hypothetical protein|nr:hypothetical protein [Crocinitomicaceae bacterium]
MISLFPNEHIITQADDNSFILTSHRVYQEERSFSRTTTKSVMLEQITSCESLNEQNFTWIVLAIISLIGLFEQQTQELSLIGFVVFLAIFFLMRKSYIKVSSPTSEIKIFVHRTSQNKMYRIVEKIEHAKVKRLDSLK